MKKLLQIKNYSTFKDFKLNNTDWDGVFKDLNLIYAPNGSGKTSISLLFESLKGDNHLILKKKNLNSKSNPEILFLGKDNKQIKFSNENWNKKIDFIEVFNSFYLEDNVYKIAPSKYNSDKTTINNIFDMEKIRDLKKEIVKLRKECSVAQTNVNKRHYELLNIKKSKAEDIEKYVKEFDDAKEKHSLASLKYRESFSKVNDVFFNELDIYKKSINKFLVKFSNDLLIKSISIILGTNFTIKQLVYDIEINGNVVQISDRSEVSLKYYLSDGDKNALALSFFLAKFELINNSQEFIVVVDDPFTSFDTHRKLTTIKELVGLSDKIKQLFILTHDLHFAHDFLNFNRKDILMLQIKKQNGDCVLKYIDIKSELLTGLMRDIEAMHKFLEVGSQDALHSVQIARCIRPSLEGIFRIKFYNNIRSTDWLGNYIEYIRDSEEGSPFFRLKNFLRKIEDVNDYSKGFHHSNSPYEEEPINEGELKLFVKEVLELIQII